MKAVLKGFALTAVVAAAIAPAYGEENRFGEVSGNVALVSDYVFRGQSQSDEDMAIQGGLDWDSGKGFYAGVWGSNVDFGTDAHAEIDYYVGYSGEFTGGVGYDVGYIYYSYAGESALDYEEVAFSLSYADVSLGVNYSDEYLGDGGESYYYLSASYEIELPEGFSLSLAAGYNSADDMDITFDGSGDDSYTDWSVMLGKEVMGVSLGVGYFGTTIDSANDLADDRVVFALSKSL